MPCNPHFHVFHIHFFTKKITKKMDSKIHNFVSLRSIFTKLCNFTIFNVTNLMVNFFLQIIKYFIMSCYRDISVYHLVLLFPILFKFMSFLMILMILILFLDLYLCNTRSKDIYQGYNLLYDNHWWIPNGYRPRGLHN